MNDLLNQAAEAAKKYEDWGRTETHNAESIAEWLGSGNEGLIANAHANIARLKANWAEGTHSGTAGTTLVRLQALGVIDDLV